MCLVVGVGRDGGLILWGQEQNVRKAELLGKRIIQGRGSWRHQTSPAPSLSGDTPSSPVPPGLGLQMRIKHVLGVELECKYSPKWQWQQSLGLPTAISALWDKAK